MSFSQHRVINQSSSHLHQLSNNSLFWSNDKVSKKYSGGKPVSLSTSIYRPFFQLDIKQVRIIKCMLKIANLLETVSSLNFQPFYLCAPFHSSLILFVAQSQILHYIKEGEIKKFHDYFLLINLSLRNKNIYQK